MSLFRLLRCCLGRIIGVFTAVEVLDLLIGISVLGLGGLPRFLFTGVESIVFVAESVLIVKVVVMYVCFTKCVLVSMFADCMCAISR